MPQIQVLDQITIDKIAAGEVIERPASIVKELVENSIDAKAASVTVEIQDGGISLIRVTDNGSGIEREDIRNAFLRHSTSKIRKVEDLAHIASLGFRGEALSSISAVTRTELITKTKEDTFGTRYILIFLFHATTAPSLLSVCLFIILREFQSNSSNSSISKII